MSDERGIGKRAIAELDHYEGEFAEFGVIDPDTRKSVSGTYPYIEASAIPEDTGPGDVFNIRYDPETENIHTLEYSEEETRKQRTRNASKMAELQEDEVVSTGKDSTVPGESGERSDGEQAIAELDHFVGEYVAFAVIDPESRDPKLGVNPYVEVEAVPEKANRGDLFEIWYDPETEEIIALEYSEEETRKQRTRNASKMAELQDDEVVSTDKDSIKSGGNDERSDGEQAIAELDHFEGKFVAFNIIDPETREVKLDFTPYIEADSVPEEASRGDIFEIVFDTETEEIRSLEFSKEETKKQKIENARRLAELQEDEVVSTDKDSNKS